MTDPTNISEDMLKKPGRRNWLRNAAIAVTSAVVMASFLTGCTKEQFPLPGGGHGGGVGGSPDAWYYLKGTFKDENGNTQTGYLRGEGEFRADPQWYYMVMGVYSDPEGSAKFRFHASDSGDGWQFWEMSDGYWLSILSTGTAYRSGQGNRTAWKIINGKLYTNYYRAWTDQALGAQWYHTAVSNAYYTSVNYGSEFAITNCELVPAQ